MPVEIQSDRNSLNPNLAASRLHKILRWDVRQLEAEIASIVVYTYILVLEKNVLTNRIGYKFCLEKKESYRNH